MKSKWVEKLAVFIFIILLLPNSTLAEKPILTWNLNIKTYEYTDAYVVGDHFYFEIFLENPTLERITSDINIKVYNSNNDIIGDRNYKDVSIEPNKYERLFAAGGYENSTAIYPFKIAGDYKIVLESNKSIDFFKLFEVKGKGENISEEEWMYVRTDQKFEYYFDVMPKWQYNLWKEEEKINNQSMDLNNKMLQKNIDMDNATQEMNSATNKIKWATYAMFIVSIITLMTTVYFYKKK